MSSRVCDPHWQAALLNPLVAPGPTMFLTAHHLGTFGVSSLRAGAPIVVKVSVGRASVSMASTYQKSFANASERSLFILPTTSTSKHTDVSTLAMHVVLYRGKNSRCVRRDDYNLVCDLQLVHMLSPVATN